MFKAKDGPDIRLDIIKNSCIFHPKKSILMKREKNIFYISKEKKMAENLGEYIQQLQVNSKFPSEWATPLDAVEYADKICKWIFCLTTLFWDLSQ